MYFLIPLEVLLTEEVSNGRDRCWRVNGTVLKAVLASLLHMGSIKTTSSFKNNTWHSKLFYLRRYLKPELLGIANGGEEWNGHIWEFFPWGLVIVPAHHLSTNPKLIWYTQLQVFKGKLGVVYANARKVICCDILIRIFLTTSARHRAIECSLMW